jgi:hypothetical protein
MLRIVVAVMAVIVALGALTACYNKPPKEAAPVSVVR